MDVYRMRGGVPLHGRVEASGAKNAVLPIMAAALLADGPVALRRVPRLRDVTTMKQVLRGLGCRVAHQGDRVSIEADHRAPGIVAAELAHRMRASFCVLGPLLARRGFAEVPLPGGCRIGARPVDLHLRGLRLLGAEIRIRHGRVIAKATRLRGAAIRLAGPRGPTVTGTANVMMAATLAHGTTVIQGAAREPEIVDLGRMLQSMGSDVRGLGTSRIVVHGSERLVGAQHQVIGDRIEAATLLIGAAITGGSLTVTGIDPRHLQSVAGCLQSMGMDVASGAHDVSLEAPVRARPAQVVARPFPGVPTDVGSQLMALAAVADGRSLFGDGVFPRRFHSALELNKLGAAIELRGGSARVIGRPRLCGGPVVASDLRGSAALVLAGLNAQGETTVSGVEHLDRGYEHLERKLRGLGADIRRERLVDLPPAAVSPEALCVS